MALDSARPRVTTFVRPVSDSVLRLVRLLESLERLVMRHISSARPYANSVRQLTRQPSERLVAMLATMSRVASPKIGRNYK